MRFADLSSHLIDQLDREIPVVFPLARTVPRGPGLPVGCEAKVLEAVVSTLDAPPFLLLPTPPFAAAPEFSGLTGRLATTPATFPLVITDVLNSVISMGFRRVLVLTVDASLSAQILVTLQQFRAENPTALLFSDSLDSLAGGAETFLGHVAKAMGLVTDVDPSEFDPPLLPSTPALVTLVAEKSTSGSVFNLPELDAEVGQALLQTARERFANLLNRMGTPATFQ
jgi:hypothetical protein